VPLCNSAPFESEIQTDGTFTHTFEAAGSHPYVCSVHPGMEGTVEVAD
jgi:plastocyanin